MLDLNEKFAAQIYLEQESRIKTSFMTPSGATYCFNTIPFGLKNAHLTVERTCDRILSEEPFENFVVRIGKKIIIFGNERADNESNFEQLQKRFLEYNLNAFRMDTPLVNATQLELFDSVISHNKLAPNPSKLPNIKYLKICQTSEQFRLFKEFFASFRDQISNFNVLNAELERLSVNLFSDSASANSPNIPNSVLTAAYNQFSSCFEQIKTRISDLINTR